jgi:hydroxymethylbilane synthase
MNHRLHGGCQVPIAGFAELEGETLRMRGLLGYPDGSALFRAEAVGDPQDPEALGILIADSLLTQGGGKILSVLGLAHH